MGTVPAINYQPTRFQTTFYKDDCVCTLGELFVVIQIHVVLFTATWPHSPAPSWAVHIKQKSYYLGRRKVHRPTTLCTFDSSFPHKKIVEAPKDRSVFSRALLEIVPKLFLKRCL